MNDNFSHAVSCDAGFSDVLPIGALVTGLINW